MGLITPNVATCFLSTNNIPNNQPKPRHTKRPNKEQHEERKVENETSKIWQDYN